MSIVTLVVLMKKDWRVFRAVVVGSIALGIIPYLVGVALFEMEKTRTSPVPHFLLADVLRVSASYGLIITALIAAAFGGQSFAAERAETSADFLILLPPSRWDIILSKLFVAVLFICACALVHATLLIVGILLTTHNNDWIDSQIIFPIVVCVGGITMLFCTAWTLSTFLKSPAISACIAIAIVVGLISILGILASEYRWHDSTQALLWGATSLVFGPICWAIGTFCYLIRVQP